MKKRIVALLSCVFIAHPVLQAQAGSKQAQVVLISFDGAHDNAQWQRSLKLGEETGARFTYFLSCVFLLSRENKALYTPPAVAPARSNVGFGTSKSDVAARLNNLWRAHVSGHEIANHGCGHFDGKDWSAADWRAEFKSFDTILTNAWATNGLSREPFGWRSFVDMQITGFRAPYLSAGLSLYAALKPAGFSYDASGVERDIALPAITRGITRFALPMMQEGTQSRRIVAMDYNLFVRHSGGFERGDENSVFENRTLDALNGMFNAQYNGPRNPVQFGLHFTLMNSGAYWRAAERFVRDVCQKPDVKCISYQDYINTKAAATGATALVKKRGS